MCAHINYPMCWVSNGRQSGSGYLRSAGLPSRPLASLRENGGGFIKIPTLEASDRVNAPNLMRFQPWQTPVRAPMRPLPPWSPSPLPRCPNTSRPIPLPHPPSFPTFLLPYQLNRYCSFGCKFVSINMSFLQRF
jgi:hypothetical protein